MDHALALKKLSLRIGKDTILSDLDLTLQPGEITGLVGRSGSGKSMTALAIMGLAPRHAEVFGEILLDGENLLEKSETEWRDIRGGRIGMVFQEPMTALNPLQSIGAQVAETILIHSNASKREALARAEETLRRVGLDPNEIPLDRYPHELSGGQRQRVVIAIAIAMHPKILICDEPTTALDVTTQAEILDLLRRLARDDDIAVLLITHDLAVISQLADRIAIIKNGKVVDQAAPQEFFGGSLSEAARELVSAPLKRPDKLSEIDAPSPVIIEARDVVCTYHQPGRSVFSSREPFRAVNGVSLSIRKGENIGLVGASGCGKSTLARALLGLQPMAKGAIGIGDASFPAANIAAMRAARRKVQIVFQDPYSSFNPRHRIKKIISEPFHLFDRPPDKTQQSERASDVLQSVGLSARDAEKYPHEFSGGQRQRIAIARALITDPEIIVLDEATSALDIAARNRVLALLQSLSEERGVSFLFITHDLSVIRDIADRTLVMKAGVIVEEGATKEIFADPQHPYTKSLIAAAPVMKWAAPSNDQASDHPQGGVGSD